MHKNRLEPKVIRIGVLIWSFGERIKPRRFTVSATGYRREAVDFADYTFTEITCHGSGASFLNPNAQGVIDIGGQDSKVIQLRNGKV